MVKHICNPIWFTIDFRLCMGLRVFYFNVLGVVDTGHLYERGKIQSVKVSKLLQDEIRLL